MCSAKHSRVRWLFLASALSGPAGTWALDLKDKPTLTIRPALIEGADSKGATLGVNYELNKKFVFLKDEKTGVDSVVVPDGSEDTPLQSGLFTLKGQGTVTTSKDSNPNKLLDLAAELAFHRSGGGLGSIHLGAVGAFETDQSFDHKQSLYGITASHTIGYFGVGLTYGEVKPYKDAERQKLVGKLDKFKRWNVELAFSMPVSNPFEKGDSASFVKLRSIEAGYRHYQEVSAPTAIRVAGKDRNRLGLVRVNFDGDFFLQYAKGSLLFDKKGDRSWQVGWSSKFE